MNSSLRYTNNAVFNKIPCFTLECTDLKTLTLGVSIGYRLLGSLYGLINRSLLLDGVNPYDR